MLFLLNFSSLNLSEILKHSGVIWIGVLLFFLGIQDLRQKEISCWWLISIIPFIVIEIITSSEITFMGRIFGGLLGFFFIILSKITKGQIGIGDGYVLCVIGIMLGISKSAILLSYAFLLTSVVSMILLIFFRWNRKKTIPFIPFIFFGYLGCILIK